MVVQARKALQDFRDQTQKSIRQISKECGLSSSVVSQFLQGIYSGDNETTAEVINRYLTIGNQRLSNSQSGVFYEGLYNTRVVLDAANYAHVWGDIVLVCGDAGAGKTTALRFYCRNNANVIFVTVNPCSSSAGAVLNLICREVGIQASGRQDVIMSRLVQLLSDSNRLLIVDEADCLTLNALQAIRHLNDEAHIGVVLAGNDKIYYQMEHGRNSSRFKQLRTRAFVRRWVTNEYDDEEISAMFPGLDKKCWDILITIATKESLRTAHKLCGIAQDKANREHRPLDAKVLQSVKKEFLGEVV